MHSLKRLNKYFKKYTKTIIAGSFFLITANVFLVWIPVFIRQTIDEIEKRAAGTDFQFDSIIAALSSSDLGTMLAGKAGLIIGAALIYGFLLFATRQTIIVTSRKIEFDIRNEVFDKLLKLSQHFYSQHDSSNIYTRATEDVNKVREYFGPAFMYTINTLSRAGIILAMMFLVSTKLTLWALIPIPLLTFMAYYLSGYIHTHSTIIQEQYSDIAERAKEAFSSIRLIKAYNRQEYEKKLFEDESESYRKKKLRLDAIESLFHPLLTLLIGTSVIIVIWQGGKMVIADELTIGNIAEFVIYVAYLTWPVASLGYTVNLYQRSLASWERIEELLDQPIKITNRRADSSLKNTEIKGKITFKNLSFKYPKATEYALKNINLTIHPGERIAIVGKTGSGKSTLLQLIPRLYDPQKGAVLVDDIDAQKYPLETLRKAIGYVPQDTFLFSDTIGENIAFGLIQSGQKDNKVENAAEKAQVLQNIREFEKQFETVLGERGITLSGGQKQRTAIARALIRKPKILIFDDSLSAVDTKTEDAILKHLEKEFANRTTITVSHRISTVKDAHKIFVMDEGRIVEWGQHEELIKRKGLYANMYKKQLLEQELKQI